MMRLYAAVILSLLLHCTLVTGQKDIDEIIKNMSLQRKIGQMILPTFLEVMNGASVNKNTVKQWWQGFGTGHMYGPRTPFVHDGKTGGLCTDWQRTVQDIQQATLESGGAPILFGLCSEHGANYIANATIFPHNIGAGATFNPALVELSGRITGKDLRTCGLAWSVAPAIDIALNPLWARHYECFSSDPYLSSVMSFHMVRGHEAKDNSNSDFPYDSSAPKGTKQVGTIVKHFIGYSTPDNGEDRSDATVPDWIMERYHVPAFRSAIAAGAAAVMLNSGSVNRVPGHANAKLTIELLRNKLKFNGTLVSDYQDVTKLVNVHRAVPNFREAVRTAVNVGLDVTMIPDQWAPTLLDLVNSGAVPVSRIDESVRRILKMKSDLGLFDASTNIGFPKNTHSVGSVEDRDTALQMAEESITMLKNDNKTLPIILNPEKKLKILVTGPSGNSIRLQAGGWSIIWDGANSDAEFYGHGATIFQAVRDAALKQQSEVSYIEGTGLESRTTWGEAIAAAASADVVVVALGEKIYVEFTYNIKNLDLPTVQLDFVTELSKVAKKLILVLVQGRPRTFAKLIPLAHAILYAYLPGPYGGPAIANVLFGQTNPSGRLPFPYPSASNQLALQYGPYKHTPTWPFGHGLSYTSFEYSNLQITPTNFTLKAGSEMTILVSVQNTGEMDGQEVVMLYMTELFAYPSPEFHFELKRFVKIPLVSGEKATVEFKLSGADFRYLIGAESSQLKVRVGTLEASFAFQAEVAVALSEPDVLPEGTTRVIRVVPAVPTASPSASEEPISEVTPPTSPNVPQFNFPSMPATLDNPTLGNTAPHHMYSVLLCVAIALYTVL